MPVSEAIPIGIDLGTTFCCVSYVGANGVARVIPSIRGRSITPSIVSFEKNLVLVGEDALLKRGSDPLNTIYQVKRLMGKQADDQVLTKFNWPFEIISDNKGKAVVRVTPKDSQSETLYPEQISASLLIHLKAEAEQYLQCEVKDAVITVPANFTDPQRQATRNAGRTAGLNVLRLIHEPTAAAVAYGKANQDGKKKTILVYDLGGGTFDVSVVEMQGIDAEVKSSKGTQLLGGEDFTDLLYEEVASRFIDKEVEIQSRTFNLRQQCETAKICLSNSTTISVDLPSHDGRCF